jgi:aldehyde dehydrogenase (NAD+)
MQTMSPATIIEQQKKCYQKGLTHDLAFRLKQLTILKQAIRKHQDDIMQAVHEDMGKPPFEALTSEIVATLTQLDLMIKHLPVWIKPVSYKMPIGHWPGSCYVLPEPYGTVLIMAPWNYPFQLAMVPLIGAMAAGNCAVVKPSEISANTSRIIARMIADHFDPEYISVAEGGVEVGRELLEQRWDFIFFTGSPRVGKIVMNAASRHLTPLILELGGKSPCIVDKDINIKVAVRRIVQGKFFNAGQTCLAPDFGLVHKEIKEEFITLMDEALHQMYGDFMQPSRDMARIVNSHHFNRLVGLIDPSKVVIGGAYDAFSLYIAPTVIDGKKWDDAIMQEEIFGPLLPIIEYDSLDEALEKIRKFGKPLSLYFFSNNKEQQERVIHETRSGSVCINDSIIHFIISRLPFGGVGASGMGQYHGRASFEAFSHKKSVLKKSLWYDVGVRFAPYTLSNRQAEWLYKLFSG